jgi:hypothetical protein
LTKIKEKEKWMKKKLLIVLLLGLISISFTGCLSMISPETNNPPVLATISDATITLGETFTYPVEATDPDEGDTLIYSLTTDPSTDMVIDENSGVINWTPTAVGNFEVNVEVSDGELSDTQSFNITVSEPLNQAPVITSVPITSVILGEIYNYTIVAIDPEEDDLTYTLITKPTGMTISIDGAIIWTPSAVGSYDVTVEVSDGELTATQSFSIVVDTVNHAPFITLIPHTIVTAGETFNYNVNANDLDGNDLTYSLTTNPSTNMTINEDSGVISWTPTAVGSFEIIVEVSDGELTATRSFTIEVIAPDRVVMVELFIYVGCYHCTIVEPILEQLAEDYGLSQMILLEEHLWGDGYDTPEINARYDWYIPSGKGTPDVLFNGLNQRRQGSSYNYSDYQSIIEQELAKEAKINISASGEKFSSSMSVNGNIKNISTSNLENLEINGMIFEERGSNGLRYLALDIFDGKEVSSISPGGTVEFSFNSENLNWQNSSKVHAVIFVQVPNSPTKEILQALYLD